MTEISRATFDEAKKLFGYPLTLKQTRINDFENGNSGIPRKNIFSYRKVKIPKKRGYRTIFIPDPELMLIQRKILRFLKKVRGSWHSNFYGLHCGSYVDHANNHKDHRWILQFDLKDAFPTVNVKMLWQLIFEELVEKISDYKEAVERYHDELSDLEKLERESIEKDGWIGLGKEYVEQSKKDMIFSPFYPLFGEENIVIADSARKLTDLIIDLTTFDGILPQGTPTAPFLFYTYLAESDVILGMMRNIPASWREQWQIKWEISCYVDGFVLSCNRPLPPEIREKILKVVIEESGLKVNEDKTRYQDSRHGAIMITGLAVDGTGKVRLPKKVIRKWRGIIHTAVCETDLEKRKELTKRIKGFVASLKPVYGVNLPKQILTPLNKLNIPLKEY